MFPIACSLDCLLQLYILTCVALVLLCSSGFLWNGWNRCCNYKSGEYFKVVKYFHSSSTSRDVFTNFFCISFCRVPREWKDMLVSPIYRTRSLEKASKRASNLRPWLWVSNRGQSQEGCFYVIFVPYYHLQCARLRVFSGFASQSGYILSSILQYVKNETRLPVWFCMNDKCLRN